MSQITPPSRMSFLAALEWCELGWSMRRAQWRLADAIPNQVAAAGDSQLVWIRGEPKGNPGIFFASGYAFTPSPGPFAAFDEIVANTRVSEADMLAKDWTLGARFTVRMPLAG